MQGRSYRLREETRAVSRIDGETDILSVPAGSIVTVTEESPRESGMIVVALGDKTVKMFRVDLLRRGDPVKNTSARSAAH